VSVQTLRLPVYDERRGAFADLRGERVLIYWPHGFGDFIHFGYVLPLLEPSNTYFITRFGDDFVHVCDGAHALTPIYSGVRAIGDGSEQGARHLGLDWKRIRNAPADVQFPEPLATRVREAGITALLYTDYPEYEGRIAYPFQTKARALVRQLVDPQRLRSLDLDPPLTYALGFDVPKEARAAIDARLRQVVEPGKHLYLVAPGGHTNVAKAWPYLEVAAFESGIGRIDPDARTLVVDERSLGALFGDLDLPFAHVLATAVQASYAFVGAAAGPLHAALAMHVCPVVGIWLAHHPDWYDEPNRDSIHLTGPRVHRAHYERRKATTTKPLELRARTIGFSDRVPSAADVFAALALLR